MTNWEALWKFNLLSVKFGFLKGVGKYDFSTLLRGAKADDGIDKPIFYLGLPS